MSEDLVKRLRGRAKFLTDLKSVKSPGLLVEAAVRIEQLERELAEYKDVVAWHEIQLAAEKALADHLIVAGANALQGDPRRDKGLADAWDDAHTAYRKARGLA